VRFFESRRQDCVSVLPARPHIGFKQAGLGRKGIAMNPKRAWNVFRGPEQKPTSAETLLSHVNLFRSLDQKQLALLAERTETRQYEAGQVVLAENETGDALYIVVSGLLHLIKERPGREPVKIGTLAPGQSFCETALVEDKPRLATVLAAEATTCLALPKSAFQDELAANPTIAVAVVLEVSRRLRDALDMLDASG
jgi:CRP/FNR family cyclic AMP-dependent transcriptional regulator